MRRPFAEGKETPEYLEYTQYLEQKKAERRAARKIEYAERKVELRRLDSASYEGLSKRQKEVSILIARGLQNKQIARTLGVSSYTAWSHRNRVYKILKVHSGVEVAHLLIALGIVEAGLVGT